MIFEQSFRLATPPGVLFTVYDSVTRTPAYIPPEYTDVGPLMNDLVSWYATDQKTPQPIKATLFLHFLNQNHALFIDGEKLIEDHALAALTILIAESRAEEKETMISVVLNCMVRV